MVNIVEKDKISRALVEVEAILNELGLDEYSRIPDDVLDFVTENKDNNYTWKYNYNESLENQNLSEYTLEILSYINSSYLLSEEQKNLMDQIYELNDEEDRSKLNSIAEIKVRDIDEIFEHNKERPNNANEPNLPALIGEKENIFKRFINKIKNFFTKNSN